jgi:hypothetical protein
MAEEQKKNGTHLFGGIHLRDILLPVAAYRLNGFVLLHVFYDWHEHRILGAFCLDVC